MRLGVFVGAAVLATASLALAESDWVSDPWAPDGTDTTTTSPAAPSPRAHALVDSEPTWLETRGSELESPWAATPAPTRPGSAPTPASGEPRMAQPAGVWAKPPTEVVDPWPADSRSKGSWVPSIDLIVDPWAPGD